MVVSYFVMLEVGGEGAKPDMILVRRDTEKGGERGTRRGGNCVVSYRNYGGDGSCHELWSSGQFGLQRSRIID